ncbi:sigma-70 family RNA polymerase sigma factor [Candidatus Peregrinibacteria bacterium]|nr:sigma-70 family RNA polymerase sigma factor [Candidatus Peregrinibacteria bacterium]
MDIKDPAEKTDEELANTALDNQEYFYYLMKRYEKRLLSYILHISNFSSGDAEDVLQEVFIKTYKNLRAFDKSLKFSSWIYRIAHNETISEYRRKKASVSTISLDDKDTEIIMKSLKSSHDIKEDLHKKDIKEKVREVIYALPAKYREVLILRYIEDKDYQEISDILKKSMGTVSTLVSRAHKHFKKEARKRKLDMLI